MIYLRFLIQFVQENPTNKTEVYKSVDYLYFMLGKYMNLLKTGSTSPSKSKAAETDKFELKKIGAKNVYMLGKLMREIYYKSTTFCKEVTEKKTLIFLNQLLGISPLFCLFSLFYSYLIDVSKIMITEKGAEVNYVYKINVVFLDILYTIMNPYKGTFFLLLSFPCFHLFSYFKTISTTLLKQIKI